MDNPPTILSPIKHSSNGCHHGAMGSVKDNATFTDVDEANCVLRRGRTYLAIAVQNLRDFRFPPRCQ